VANGPHLREVRDTSTGHVMQKMLLRLEPGPSIIILAAFKKKKMAACIQGPFIVQEAQWRMSRICTAYLQILMLA
jgi:hypothetical protein